VEKWKKEKDMKRVLLVDDEDAIREALSYILERCGVEVFTAASGREALDKYEEFRPHAVLLDVHLPDISGIEVIRRFNESEHRSKVYFVSGNPEALGGSTVVDLGAQAFLLKPVDVGMLRELIEWL